MRRPPINQRAPESSAAYAFLQLQEPLPPYELDPSFSDPVIRKRIGDVIAQAMDQNFRVRDKRN
jgi:hypothetical protein